MGDQSKNIARSNLKLRGPAGKHTLVVRQEAPQVGSDDGTAVLPGR